MPALEGDQHRDRRLSRAVFLELFYGTRVSQGALRKLRRLGVHRSFAPRQVIFSERESAATVFGLSEGLVCLHTSLRDGRRQVMKFVLPGEFLGMPFVEFHKVSAQAVGAVSVCGFPRDELRRLMDASPGMARLLINFAVREVELAQEQQVLLANASAEQRVVAFLVGWRARLAKLGQVSRVVPLPMRRRDIADFLGLEPETLSRTFASLEQKKLIRIGPKGVTLTGLARKDNALKAA
jgi:CRP/FNR family transcriptional regulator